MIADDGGLCTRSVIAITFVDLQVLERTVYLELLKVLPDMDKMDKALRKTWNRRKSRGASVADLGADAEEEEPTLISPDLVSASDLDSELGMGAYLEAYHREMSAPLR